MSTQAVFSSCGFQTRHLASPFRPQLAARRVQGRSLRFTCAADSSLSDREAVKAKEQQVAKQRAEALERIKRKDRPELFTDNWGGDVWKGNKVNTLSVILAISILVPLGGLVFAYLTFGTLWG